MHSRRMRTGRLIVRIWGVYLVPVGRVYLVLGGCTWSQGVYLVWGVYLVRGVYLVPGGVYLVLGGSTWSRGCTWSGGCTWSQRVYLIGGSTWSRGCTCSGGCLPGTPPWDLTRYSPPRTDQVHPSGT